MQRPPFEYEITPPGDFAPITVEPAEAEFDAIEATPSTGATPEPVAPVPAPVEVAASTPDTGEDKRRAGKD